MGVGVVTKCWGVSFSFLLVLHTTVLLMLSGFLPSAPSQPDQRRLVVEAGVERVHGEESKYCACSVRAHSVLEAESGTVGWGRGTLATNWGRVR